MIERRLVNGTMAAVVYLKSDFSPCSRTDADIVKVLFDDGTQVFGTARRKDAVGK